MNIGAGNAATALAQMFERDVDMNLPNVYILPTSQASSILRDPSLPVVCVKMNMVGDVTGNLFFIVPDEHKVNLTYLTERAIQVPKNRGTDVDLSVLTEVGNIVAGVYLTAVHDFCRLTIYHTVPTTAIDMIQSLLDESLNVLSSQIQMIVVIESEFIVDERCIKTFFLMIPSVASVKTMVNSIGEAEIACTSE